MLPRKRKLKGTGKHETLCLGCSRYFLSEEKVAFPAYCSEKCRDLYAMILEQTREATYLAALRGEPVYFPCNQVLDRRWAS